MKSQSLALWSVSLFAQAVFSQSATTTYSVVCGTDCPSGTVPDVIVTRSPVPTVPCKSDGSACPTFMSVKSNGTMTYSPMATYTGAADRTAVEGGLALAGVFAYLIL